MKTASSEPRTIILRPSRGFSFLDFRELWIYRELVYFLTWRSLKVRYKQTVLGAVWAVLEPFLTMVVFTIFFGNLAKVGSDNIPYPIWSYAGLLPWGLFYKALSDASRSLVANSHMITKIYFPRIILPLSSILAGLVDFAIAFVVLIGMMLFYKQFPTSAVWTLPLFLLLAMITALGVALWLSALNVKYRDVGYILPFLTQFWLFITPVVYPSSQIPEQWRLIYGLNPMTGVVEGFRWALLGINPQPTFFPMLAVSAAMAIVVLFTGILYFRRMERGFADMV